MPDIDIAGLMAPLGPFERPPAIAVAVSGGSDSLGLGLMLAEWVRERDGHLHVLTVDHGLRPEAADECARVAAIFAAIPNCSAHVLRWDGEKPARGVQAAARAARYALMTDWCRAHGVLHLAVAHTADDQAETVAMRRAHGSGAVGLAGMAAARPENGVRLLRPFLSVSRASIRAWLQACGQTWIEDPSNELTKFERVRVRQSLDAEMSVEAIELAVQLGKTRNARERQAARLLSEAGQVHEAGYVSVGLKALRAAAPEMQATVLRQLMLAVSGADYAPDVETFLGVLAAGEPAARTLGGCLLERRRERLHVFREAAAIGEPVPVGPGWRGAWDGRFALLVSGDLAPTDGWAVGPLGDAGLRQAVDRFGIRLKRHPIPLPARLALPALWQAEHLVAQPHLKLGEGLAAKAAPRHSVTTCGFTVAAGRPHTIYSSTLC
jgi:tRNA(Ile)-lysidine synthase